MRADHMTQWLINASLGVGDKEGKTNEQADRKKRGKRIKEKKHLASKTKCRLIRNDPQSGGIETCSHTRTKNIQANEKQKTAKRARLKKRAKTKTVVERKDKRNMHRK